MYHYRKSLYHLDVVYPNKMYGGIYSLGPLIIYNIVNQRPHWHCERVFLDHGKIRAPLVGFSLQYELDLPKALSLKPKKGFTFAGGPLVALYPGPIAQHFDFIILGDIEAVLPFVLDAYEKNPQTFLKNIEGIQGVYLSGKNSIRFAQLQDFDTAPYPLVQPFPHTITQEYVFGKCFILETERGCPFHCSFCAIPIFYNKKICFHSLDYLKQAIDQGLVLNDVRKVVLYAPSFLHPQRKELLQYLLTKNVQVRFPSLKAEHMDLEILQLMKACGQNSLTIAPECGERLRFTLHKNVTDAEYFNFARLCSHAGIEKLKLYLQIGLPGMTAEDISEMCTFVQAMQTQFKGKLSLSINYFVPKPGTALAHHSFTKKIVKKQAQMLYDLLPNVKVKMPKLSTSYFEWNLFQNSYTKNVK